MLPRISCCKRDLKHQLLKQDYYANPGLIRNLQGAGDSGCRYLSALLSGY